MKFLELLDRLIRGSFCLLYMVQILDGCSLHESFIPPLRSLADKKLRYASFIAFKKPAEESSDKADSESGRDLATLPLIVAFQPAVDELATVAKATGLEALADREANSGEGCE